MKIPGSFRHVPLFFETITKEQVNTAESPLPPPPKISPSPQSKRSVVRTRGPWCPPRAHNSIRSTAVQCRNTLLRVKMKSCSVFDL